ncbi:Glycosyltransferase AglE [uncultured archaeon]|nr:Glycosyltransferase AglE [uncultured archaeon]
MPDSPLVSIITPTYNHEKFIGQCLESVLSQTYPHWEQIVIDDGSSDRTGEIISQYNDKRIKYMRQENKGIWRLGETYNKALQLSKGDYIAILEGDDFWPPDKLEIQIKAFDRSDVVLSWGKALVVDSQGKKIAVLPEDVLRFQNMSREKVLGDLLFGNSMHSCTIVCRKSALLSIGGFKQPGGIPCVDGPTWLELCLVGNFLPLDEILGCYRRHNIQISSVMKTSMVRAGRYSQEFFVSLPADARASLAEVVPDISARLERKSIENYYYQGRAYLRERKWHEAKENFLKAIHEKNTASIKAKAMLGILFSYFRTDLESFAGLSDRLGL